MTCLTSLVIVSTSPSVRLRTSLLPLFKDMRSTRRVPPLHLSLPPSSFGQTDASETFTPSPLSSPFILLPDALPSAYHASNAFSTPPSTPPCGSNAGSLFGTRRQLRRNSSLSSLASEEEEMEEEWTEEEEEKLRRVSA